MNIHNETKQYLDSKIYLYKDKNNYRFLQNKLQMLLEDIEKGERTLLELLQAIEYDLMVYSLQFVNNKHSEESFFNKIKQYRILTMTLKEMMEMEDKYESQ